MIAHVMGLPIEESFVQLVPIGAVLLPAVVIAGRRRLVRVRRWLRRAEA